MSQTAVESRSQVKGREPLAVAESPQFDRVIRQSISTPSQSIQARPDRLYHIVLLALCTSVLLIAAILTVRDRSQVVLPFVQFPLPELCTMRRLAGIDCPGCGLTRCFISLAHGDLAAAWSYNPAGLWLFAIMVFQIPFRSYQLWRIGRGRPEIVIPWALQIALGILAIGLIVQWSLRFTGTSFR